MYLDEDAMQQGLVTALRARRVDVLTASDARMIQRSDEDHLRWATREERVLYSFNMADYCSLPQQRYSAGEQLRRLLHLVSKKTAAEMRCRLEYLSAWGER